MNLAETGNAAWKPKHQLSLTAAAKDDTASMLNQVSHYKKFREGKRYTKGYGQSDKVKAQKAVRKQFIEGEEFGDLFEDMALLEQQQEGEENPPMFRPARRAKGGRKPNTKTVQGKTTSRRGSKAPAPGPTITQVPDQLAKAKATVQKKKVASASSTSGPCSTMSNNRGVVLSSGPQPRQVRPVPSTPEVPNPPTIIKVKPTVSVCQGCPKAITPGQMKPPFNLIVCMDAVRPYPVTKRNREMWYDQIKSAYFHMKKECLLKHNPQVNLAETTMDKAFFHTLTQAHLDHLQEKGFLEAIIHNMEQQGTADSDSQ